MKHVALVACVLICSMLHAQDSLTQRRNTIRVDITSHFIYRNAFILSYERIFKSNRSFVVSGGYQQFPQVSRLGDRIGVKSDRQKNGFKFGADYRFYLRKENKFAAPRGVYIGPYFTYHLFNNNRLLEVNNAGTKEEAVLDSRFTIFNLGFQLGYQFIINNRWAIDVSFIGPSLSHYKYTLDIEGNYTFNKDDITNEIILDLIDRFPMLDDVLSGDEITRKGKLDTWSFGYRYQLTVGYHFGRRRR